MLCLLNILVLCFFTRSIILEGMRQRNRQSVVGLLSTRHCDDRLSIVQKTFTEWEGPT